MARAGRAVSRAMQIPTLASRGEIEGFLAGVEMVGPALSDEELALVDRQWRRVTGQRRVG